MASTKQRMRETAIEQRHAFVESCSPEDLQELEWQRTEQLFELETVQKALKEGARVGLYHPLKSEASTIFLMETLHKNGISLALPRIMSEEGLVFQAYSLGDELVKSPLGVREPLAAVAVVKPTVYIVPLLAFDPANHRLGYGKGHYDRYLSTQPKALKIGWAYPCQRVDQIPTESHDVVLDYVVTG